MNEEKKLVSIIAAITYYAIQTETESVNEMKSYAY